MLWMWTRLPLPLQGSAKPFAAASQYLTKLSPGKRHQRHQATVGVSPDRSLTTKCFLWLPTLSIRKPCSAPQYAHVYVQHYNHGCMHVRKCTLSEDQRLCTWRLTYMIPGRSKETKYKCIIKTHLLTFFHTLRYCHNHLTGKAKHTRSSYITSLGWASESQIWLGRHGERTIPERIAQRSALSLTDQSTHSCFAVHCLFWYFERCSTNSKNRMLPWTIQGEILSSILQTTTWHSAWLRYH